MGYWQEVILGWIEYWNHRTVELQYLTQDFRLSVLWQLLVNMLKPQISVLVHACGLDSRERALRWTWCTARRWAPFCTENSALLHWICPSVPENTALSQTHYCSHTGRFPGTWREDAVTRGRGFEGEVNKSGRQMDRKEEQTGKKCGGVGVEGTKEWLWADKAAGCWD